MGTADVAYDRTSDFLEPDQFIKLIDWEGNEAIYKVARDEPMGTTRVLFADAANPLPAAPGPGNETPVFDTEWLEPPRENRLYQITPYFEFRFLRDPVVAAEDRGRCVPVAEWPCSVDLRLFNPSGTQRLGTGQGDFVDFSTTLGIARQNIGGLTGGVIPSYLMPLRDDLSHVWDLWTVFGTFPAFQVVNRSALALGAAVADDFPAECFLCFTGRRYMIQDPTAHEKKMVENNEPGYEHRAITVGGVSPVTTRA